MSVCVLSLSPASAMRKERQNYDPAETCEGQRKRLKGSSLWVLCRRGGSQVREREREREREKVLRGAKSGTCAATDCSDVQ